jgi:ABC-type glycerol-3-phosphate transport system substrate-binding protein
VKAAGASGAAYGLAGCVGGGGGSTATPTESDQISTEPPSSDVTVQLATDSNFKSAGDAIVETMRENGGLPDTVSIEWTAGSFESGDRQAKYQQLLNAGNTSPTIMMMDNGWTIPFIARNQLANLSQALPDSITSTVKEDYVQTMVATATGSGGDLYAIPLFADFPTIQYRKDVLREAGYSDDDFDTWATEPLSWQEFSTVVAEGREVLSGMLDSGTTAQGFNWQGDAYVGLACCDFVEFMGSWGGSYFGEIDNLFGPVGDREVTVDEEQVVDALRMMRTFIHGQDDPEALEGYEQISPENVVSYTEEPSRKPFTDGRAVALRNWPYSININGSEENFGEDLGVMPIPYHTTADESPYGPEIGGSTSALGGWHLALNPNATDEKKQAAVQVFQALQSDQVRLDMFEIGGYIPPIPDLIDTEQTRELDLIGRYVDTLQVASENAVPRPVTAVWPQQSSKVSEAVNKSLRQEKAPEAALSDLADAMATIEEQA